MVRTGTCLKCDTGGAMNEYSKCEGSHMGAQRPFAWR
jgi:hypothetical protein